MSPRMQVWLLGSLFGLAMGCFSWLLPTPVQAAEPIVVDVSKPVAREVTDYEIFTGRMQASQTVEVRARVTGYLNKVHFKAGADVKQGELLAEIDPRPYQAVVEQVRAEVVLQQARLKRAEADFKRAQALLATKAISQEDVTKFAADFAAAQAALKVAMAKEDVARLSLDWTQVKAPIAGRIGLRTLDAGNLVKADETVLATVVAVDPMYVYFDMDERSFLQYRRQKGENKNGKARVPLFIGLQSEEGFPHEGVLVAVDNKVNSSTSTVRAQGMLSNAKGRFLPGQFVRVKMPFGAPRKALLVGEEAIQTDFPDEKGKQRQFLYVVNSENVVEARDVQWGKQEGQLRVVRKGLQPGDNVVVNLSGKWKAGDKVQPRLVAMPGAEKGKPKK